MTAAASSGGTPEPPPDTGGNTRGGAAPEPGPPPGPPPPVMVPAPPARPPDVPAVPPPGAPDVGSRPRDGFWTTVGEVLGVAPGSSRRKLVVTVLVLVVLACAAVFRDTLVDTFLSDRRTAQGNDSNKEYDAEQLPFTVSVEPERSEPEQWAMVLDRELTGEEVRKMQASSDVFSYLTSLGGRPLTQATFLEHAPKRYTGEETADGRLEWSDTLKMIVLSTRQYPVTVNGWKVTDLTCRESTAKTVVALPPQGGVPYEGIQLHLPPRAYEPVRTDDEGQGEPYFATGFIDVGNGQSSGGLRAEVIAPRGQTCEWGLKVRYKDTHVPGGQWIQLKDDKGEPLRIRSESVPVAPRQKWVFGSVPWTPCHEKPEDMCFLI